MVVVRFTGAPVSAVPVSTISTPAMPVSPGSATTLPDTKDMFGTAQFAAMKRGVLIVNTARGPLIDEADLAAALACGKVGGAALDVLSSEPPAADNPLLGAPNCLVTPHIAWGAREARQRIMDTAAENLARFLAGEAQNVVNA